MDRPNLKSLAKELGLSVTTVSRALKDGPEVKAETKSRVKEVAKRLGYQTNVLGLGLRTGQSNTLVVLQSTPREGEISNAGFMSIIEGMNDRLLPTNYRLTILPVPESKDFVEQIAQLVTRREADGFFISSTEPQDERVKYLLERNVPFVTFGRTDLFTQHPRVDMDHEDVAYRATKRFLRLGRERFWFLLPPKGLTYSRQFIRGIEQATREENVPADNFRIDHSPHGVIAGYQATKVMLASSFQPEAIFCGNDMTMIGVASAARENQSANLDEILLIANGGTPLTLFSSPPIPCYFVSHNEVGREMANLMMRRLDGEEVNLLNCILRAEFLESPGDLLQNRSKIISGSTRIP